MKGICVICEEEPGTEPWFGGVICDKCLAKKEKEWKSSSRSPKIIIQTPEDSNLLAAATYRHGYNEIILRESEEFSMELILSHEFIHYILNHFINVQTSFCYDNVSGYGEIEKYLEL